MPPAGTGYPRSSAGLGDASAALISTALGKLNSKNTYHLYFLAIIMFLHEYLVFKVVSLAIWKGPAPLLANLRGRKCLRIPRGSIELREIQCGRVQT